MNPPVTLIICAYRSLSLPTHHRVVQLFSKYPEWNELVCGEAGIARARSVAASQWYRDTTEDVFLMLDDDIVFEPEDAVRIVDQCRNGHDIIAAVYPFRDGRSVAVRTLPGQASMQFGPGAPPQEVQQVATGFFAVHRRVLEAMIPTLPLCFGNQPGAFWPFFDFSVVYDKEAGCNIQLSEDYNFCLKARELGFKVWVDRSIFLGHLGQVQVTLDNMAALKAALSDKVKPALSMVH